MHLRFGEEALDDAAVLHGLGHHLSRYRRADGAERRACSVAAAQELDRRDAFSEAWADVFSSLVRSDPRRNGVGEGPSTDLERPGAGRRGPGDARAVAAALWDLVDGNSGLPDTDGDGLALPVSALWKAFCTVNEGPDADVAALADALVKCGALTPAQWNAAFEPLGLALPMPTLPRAR